MKLNFFKGYPSDAPLLVVDIPEGYCIARNHLYVASDGNVNVNSLRKWDQETLLITILNEAIKEFSTNIPLVFYFYSIFLFFKKSVRIGEKSCKRELMILTIYCRRN
jgi:hypothetical protein